MKATVAIAVLSVLAGQAAAHSTWQQLWVNGVDQAGTCIRRPPSNSPVTDVGSRDIVCNVGGTRGVSGVCTVPNQGTVTVEMHGHDSRACSEEAIGGQHYGPILVYLSKVTDATTADGSSPFFKIFEDSWSKVAGTTRGDNDNWGVKDLNACCGKLDVKLPPLPSGDYLLRAETIALHAAGPGGGAQFYMSCYQIRITGGSGSVPAGVTFPGAYKRGDPGFDSSIHGTLTSYTAPGPKVVAGGQVKVAGSSGCSGAVVGGGTFEPVPTTSPATPRTTTASVAPPRTTTTSSSVRVTTTSSAPAAGGSQVAQYGQCGGSGYQGSGVCASPFKCVVLNPYYSQCQ